jgi:hypothetical protein
MNTDDKPVMPEHTFDIDAMELSAEIVDAIQLGNYLHCTTDKGLKFRQHVRQGKVLNKRDGRFVLENVVVG